MKKVLIITYQWPPAGGISVLRSLKFAKYLRKFGWEPIIYTAKDPAYQYLDPTNEKDVPDGLEIHKTKIWEPINAFKLLSGRKKSQPVQDVFFNKDKHSIIDSFSIWLRGNFFIPDARCFWINPSVRYLSKYLENNHIDAIFTDGPTHTNTAIGLQLAKKFNIPWLADFQDPWTQVDYYQELPLMKWADRKHKRIEQEVFKNASKITIASPTWKKDLESIGAENVDVIYYGYDEDDFINYAPIQSDEFIIFHGGLLGRDRSPDSLLKAVHDLLQEFPDQMKHVRIVLAGQVDMGVKEIVSTLGLENHVEFLGMIPRSEVITYLETASLLLLPINKADNAKGRIPGKLFELLRANKPILVLGPEGGDVESIVESKQKGKSFEYDDYDKIYQFLLQCILENKFENYNSTIDVSEYSNEQLTEKLSIYLNEISV